MKRPLHWLAMAGFYLFTAAALAVVINGIFFTGL